MSQPPFPSTSGLIFIPLLFVAVEPRRVTFNLERNTIHETLSPFEYERQGEFDPEASHAQWEKEEVCNMGQLRSTTYLFQSQTGSHTVVNLRITSYPFPLL
jgi:hypothetical protein